MIVNSVLNLAWDLEGALREARVLALDGFLTMRACSRTSRFRPPPCRLRGQCPAPLALAEFARIAVDRAGFSLCSSSASAPSNLTAPTSPKSGSAGRSGRRRLRAALANALSAAFRASGAPCVVVCPLREMPENACEQGAVVSFSGKMNG
ncbi:MAG: hypothetical protein ACLTMP_00945 [Eggerthella lenta]